jgi:Mlc titration factor MtfA (ptsG expression regulator)
MGILDFFRKARYARILESRAIPDSLWEWARAEHRIFNGMPYPDCARLRKLATLFLATKRFDPVQGAEIDDYLKLSVAAQACLPLVGLCDLQTVGDERPDELSALYRGLSWYRGFATIFVTPDAYRVTQRHMDEAGVVDEYEDEFAGEAFALGPVALSIPDIEASGWGDGYNVIIHEMAHKLDGLDGHFDGCPPLHADMDPDTWKAEFTKAWEDFRARQRIGTGGRKGPSGGDEPSRTSKGMRMIRRKRSRIDPYAAESPDEFFAVLCEYFWEKPSILRAEYPAVFAQLVSFFRRDPLAWRQP